jgi:hypothetical protein
MKEDTVSKLMTEEGLYAARRLAGWNLGDPGWANHLIWAYLNPKESNDRLDAQKVPAKTGTYRTYY